jgi:hypothetical protein
VGGERNEIDVTITIFDGTGNENDLNVKIFYLASNGRYFLSLNDAAPE